MPYYPFRCESCGLESEEWARIEARDDPVPCPKCLVPMARQFARPTPKVEKAPESKEVHPKSFGYVCEGCGHEDFERRLPEQRDDPLECPQCQGAMKYKFEVTRTVNIIDHKVLKLPGRKPVHKSRKRQLGTGLGRIEPLKIAHEMSKLEKYDAEIEKSEKAELAAKKEQSR